MKKYLSLLVTIAMVIPQLSAAQSFEDEIDAELGGEGAALSVSTQSVSSQPVYIVNQAQAQNQQSQAAESVQKQPVTLIQASPVSDSRAEQIRKARQDAELETEQKIVEKLEASRMEDEKRRAQALFGDRLENQQAAQAVAQPIVVQAPVTVESVRPDTRDLVREELRAAMKEEEEAAMMPTESRYFGATVGIADLPDVSNVTGNYALGASFGTIYDDALIVEGSFLMSNYSVDPTGFNTGFNYYQVDVNQYSGALAAKYQLFNGMVRPVIGGLVQYSYRTFNWQDVYGNNLSSNGGQSASSHAIDLGVIVGTDLAFSPKFSLGFDFRYMMNMSSRTSGGNYWAGYQAGTPIEKLQYYVMGIVGRVNF
jgi:hypothetical protein